MHSTINIFHNLRIVIRYMPLQSGIHSAYSAPIPVSTGSLHCNFHMNLTESNYRENHLELFPEGDSMTDISDRYCKLYRDLAELIGDAAARKLWKEYGGTSVTFPTRLYSKEYIRRFIQENIGEITPADMARELHLTERRVRQIIHDLKENG